MQNYTLKELIKPNILQQIQDAFSDYTGMAAVTTDVEGVPITSGSNFTHFCSELVRSTEIGCANCRNCDRSGAAAALKSGSPTVYRCHAGLADFAAPIMLNGDLVGCFVGGQVVVEEPDDSQCRKTAEEYGIDGGEYLSALKSIKRMDRADVERSAKLLYDISKALSSMALLSCSAIENSKSMEIAARSQSDYIMSLTSDMTSITLDYMDTAKEALDSGDPAQMKEALEVITTRGTGASEMIRDSIAYLQMIGRRFRMSEEEYDPRKVFPAIIATLGQKNDGIKLTLNISQEVSERLLGDAGGICHLIEKFAALFKDNGGSVASVNISSFHHGYAECLIVSLGCRDASFTDEAIAKIKKIITSDEEYYAETMSELGLSIVRNQLRTMSGKFEINCGNGGVEIDLIIPQLKLKGGVS